MEVPKPLQLPRELHSLLFKWKTNFEHFSKKYNLEIPELKLTKSVLIEPNVLNAKKLARFLQNEFECDIGFMPPKTMKLETFFTKNVVLTLQNEMHQVYWMLMDLIKEQEGTYGF